MTKDLKALLEDLKEAWDRSNQDGINERAITLFEAIVERLDAVMVRDPFDHDGDGRPGGAHKPHPFDHDGDGHPGGSKPRKGAK